MKNKLKTKLIKNSYSKIKYNKEINKNKNLEMYIIKLIDEAEEYLKNGGETITLEEWRREIEKEYNVEL